MNHELKNKIDILDLKSVRDKFISRKSWWWKTFKNNIEQIESDYRKFLYLIGTAGTTMVPWSQDLDDFWHEHILDTAKYAKDCQDLFGKMIHHNPHLPKGTYRHNKASTDTHQAYKLAFQETPPIRVQPHWEQGATKEKVKSTSKSKKPSTSSKSTTDSSCGSVAPISTAAFISSCGTSASCSTGSSCGSSCGGGGGCGSGCGGGCGSD